jgi:hypothetical protein
MEASISFKGSGRMWLGMDSRHYYHPNRSTRHRVLQVVVGVTGIDFNALVGESKRTPVVRARQLAAYYLRACTDMSLPQIGWTLGQRDHSTMCHAIDRIRRCPWLYEPHLTEAALALGIVAPAPPAIQNRERKKCIHLGENSPKLAN